MKKFNISWFEVLYFVVVFLIILIAASWLIMGIVAHILYWNTPITEVPGWAFSFLRGGH